MLKRKIGVLGFLILFILGFISITKAQTDTKPYIDSLDPIQGPIGTEVAINGNSFGSEKGVVVFYNTKKATISSWSDEQIVCKVPAGALSGNVVVTSKEGDKSNALKYKVLTAVLIAPSGLKSENLTTKSVTLKWNKATGAVSYSISLGTDSKATNLKTVDVEEASYDKGSLAANKMYYWKIRAISSNPKKDSGWSRIVSFKTKAEEVKPVAPVQTQKNGPDTTTIIVIAVIIFIIIFGLFLLIRFFTRRRQQNLGETGETDLRAEPEETSTQDRPEQEMPKIENKPGLDNISGPPNNTPGDSYQVPREPQPPSDESQSDNLPPSSPDQPGKF
jgi:hypothetical protein